MDIKMADRLIELRKRHGYSQEDLADKLSISRQAVSKWERAESSPDTDNLLALSRLYGITIDDMLNNDNVLRIVSGNDKDSLKVSDEEADDYLRMYKHSGIILGIGIACILLSVMLLLTFMSYVESESVGFIVFFVTLVIGIGIILFAVFPLRRFEYIERNKKLIELTQAKQLEFTEKYKRFSPKFLAFLILSISIILLSIIPLVVIQHLSSVIVMLGCIALAVFIIVVISFEYSVYEKLLGINKRKL